MPPLRKSLAEVDVAGDLEPGQGCLAVVAQVPWEWQWRPASAPRSRPAPRPGSVSGAETTAHSSTAGWRRRRVLDLDRRDVLAAADDDVLRAILDQDVALIVDHGHVAGVEPAVADRLGSWLRDRCSSRPSRCSIGRRSRRSGRRPRGRRCRPLWTTRIRTPGSGQPVIAWRSWRRSGGSASVRKRRGVRQRQDRARFRSGRTRRSSGTPELLLEPAIRVGDEGAPPMIAWLQARQVVLRPARSGAERR